MRGILWRGSSQKCSLGRVEKREGLKRDAWSENRLLTHSAKNKEWGPQEGALKICVGGQVDIFHEDACLDGKRGRADSGWPWFWSEENLTFVRNGEISSAARNVQVQFIRPWLSVYLRCLFTCIVPPENLWIFQVSFWLDECPHSDQSKIWNKPYSLEHIFLRCLIYNR